MTRFVVCGEALIDLVGLPEGGDGHFATHWEAQAAGGPMTTAIALAQLGRDAQFLGRLSTDSFGRQIRQHLTEVGAGTDLAVVTEEATSVAVISLDELGRASYTFHFAQTANFGWQPDDLPALADDDWLHIGSLALIVPPGGAVLTAWAGQSPGPMSIDVNVRPAVLADPAEYWERIEPWLRLAGRRGGWIKGSDEDFGFLARGAGHPSWESLVTELAATYGVSGVAVTLGPDGARLELPDGQQVVVEGLSRDLVDTVGAGDTFMAALIDGVERGLPHRQTLRRAVAASAIVVSRRGARPPSADELDDLVAESWS